MVRPTSADTTAFGVEAHAKVEKVVRRRRRAWFTVPYEASVVHTTYAIDLNTPELAAGWADDVFIASVESQESAERDTGGLLYSPFQSP